MSEFREHYAPAALYQATGLEPVLEAFLANSSAPTREWASQVGRKGKDPESLYEGSGLGFARTFLWAICVYLTGANRSPTKPPVFPTASSKPQPHYITPQSTLSNHPPPPPPPPTPPQLTFWRRPCTASYLDGRVGGRGRTFRDSCLWQAYILRF